MDLLTSSLLCPLLIWLLLQAFNSIINGSKSSQQKLPPACQHHEVGLTWIPVSPLWRTLRKVCNTHVFASMKLDATQYLRRNKIQELVANVGESCHKGEAIKIGQAVFDTTINLLSNTIFSVDLADPNLSSAQEFRKIKIDPKGVRRWMTVHFNKLLNLFGNMFDERRQSRQSQDYSVSNDVLDTLFDIIEGGIEKLNKIIVTKLFLVLLKAKKKLDEAIDKENPVEESDINRLPYLQAIIKETFRMHPAVPLLLPRQQALMLTFAAIGKDRSIWNNLNSFMPERFLGSEIDVKGKDFGLIPFGAGRRICPRLLLANRMLHLILGYLNWSLINYFDRKLEGGILRNEMNMEEKYRLAVQRAEPLRAIPILV
uniref:Cytochrome P450 n=1 Tax=Gossypium raimondii TaxID=29730 RepID=A0A0D2QEB2_GOSRA|nr:hypothetical protein B456_006G211200 [Gossypium raimondii]